MEDERIIQKLFQRDEAGLAAIETLYGGLLRRLSVQICGNQQDAEEIVNDTLAAAWDAIPPARPRVLYAFLARITRNLSCKALRYRQAEKRAGTVPLDDVMEELLPAFSGEDESAAESEKAAIAAVINDFLGRCGETDRTLFVRRYYFAEPVQSIAKVLGVSPDTVSQRLHRMRVNLAAELKLKGVHL